MTGPVAPASKGPYSSGVDTRTDTLIQLPEYGHPRLCTIRDESELANAHQALSPVVAHGLSHLLSVVRVHTLFSH